MATTATAPQLKNQFGEEITDTDLVYTDQDRSRMRDELSQIPAVQALMRATAAA